jgi:hypothetical protein
MYAERGREDYSVNFCGVRFVQCSSLWRSERRTGVPTALYPLRGGAFHTEIAEKKAKSKDLIGSFFAVV